MEMEKNYCVRLDVKIKKKNIYIFCGIIRGRKGKSFQNLDVKMKKKIFRVVMRGKECIKKFSENLDVKLKKNIYFARLRAERSA